jgi:hypothetical protein
LMLFAGFAVESYAKMAAAFAVSVRRVLAR